MLLFLFLFLEFILFNILIFYLKFVYFLNIRFKSVNLKIADVYIEILNPELVMKIPSWLQNFNTVCNKGKK